jgi:hypothetical protein
MKYNKKSSMKLWLILFVLSDSLAWGGLQAFMQAAVGDKCPV